uniref:desmoglein-2-like isoform X2 n=1 Tax=Pristiophorus japonicus TaxID=55135 RepID=UPI00398F17DB
MWIRAGLLLLSLLLTYCEVGQCSCQRGFSKFKVAVIEPQVSEEEIVLTVQFHDCGLGRNIRFSTSDSGFIVLPDGSVRATRPQTFDCKHEFKVLAEDLETGETWEMEIQIVPSKKTELAKRGPQVIRFPAKRMSRRQKREWIIPPVDIREHEPPMKNPICVIRSDAEDIAGVTITYTVTGPGVNQPPIGLFVIDQRTGELSITGQVDREINSKFMLLGEAFDQFGQRREKTIELVIKIIDINDNPPIFTEKVFEGSVEELSAFSSSVMMLTATDADEGENAIINYRIISEYVMKEFTATTNGEIKVMNSHLDRETQDFYTFIVEARDKSGSSQGLFTTATAQIRILDVNDNVPVIEQTEFTATVIENSKNVEVIRIRVFDQDQEFTDNWLAHFDIIEGNEKGHFGIEVDNHTNEGILFIHKEMNYEEMNLVNLLIRISNKAPYHSSVPDSNIIRPIKIKLQVKDVKEGYTFKPVRWPVSITESTTHKEVHQVLGIYNAVSADTGKTSKMTKYAKNDDVANWLVINSETGQVTFVGIPDRESRYVVNGTYTATILAINNENHFSSTSTGTIVLKVQDANDHAPKFETSHLCMCSNSKLLKLTAFDPDGAPYGAPFRFKIDTNEKWRLGHTDATSMELVPIHELWPEMFTVPVWVEDNDGNGHTVKLDVKVTDCLDTTMCHSEKLIQSPKAVLVIPLLLMVCQFGGRADRIIIPDDFKGIIDKTNIEGGGEVDTSLPFIVPVREGKIATEAGKGGAIARTDLWAEEDFQARQMIPPHKWDVWYKASGTKLGRQHWSGSWSATRLMEGSCRDYVQCYINEKLLASATESQSHQARDCLLVYSNEGENSPVGSLDSCSFIEDALEDDSFLNDLGPQFRTLAAICRGQSESPSGAAGASGTWEAATSGGASIRQEHVAREESVSSKAVTLQRTTVSPPPALKHVVVTTTINPSWKEPQGMPEPTFVQKSAATSVRTAVQDASLITDPPFATQFGYVAGGMQGTIPSLTPVPVVQKSVVVTSSVNSGTGEMPGVIADPLVGQIPVIQKNVEVTSSFNSSTADIKGMITDPSVSQIPLIQKNIAMTRSVNPHAGALQGFNIPPKLAMDDNLRSSKSGGGAYRSVKKVTQTVQLMQE